VKERIGAGVPCALAGHLRVLSTVRFRRPVRVPCCRWPTAPLTPWGRALQGRKDRVVGSPPVPAIYHEHARVHEAHPEIGKGRRAVGSAAEHRRWRNRRCRWTEPYILVTIGSPTHRPTNP